LVSTTSEAQVGAIDQRGQTGSQDDRLVGHHLTERVGLQLAKEFVLAADAAEENRPLIAHQLAAAAGENKPGPDQARPV